MCCHTQGHQDSIRFLDTALRIYEGLYGREHTASADTVANMGAVFSIHGHQDMAVEQFKKAGEIYSNIYGGNSVGNADVLRELGAVYLMQGNYEEAVIALYRASDIFGLRLGSDHDDTVQTLCDLTVVLYQAQRCCKTIEGNLGNRRITLLVYRLWEVDCGSRQVGELI